MGKLGNLVVKAVGAPVRALMPKNPWLRVLIIAIPILIVFAFLEPVLSLLGRGVELVARMLTPLLDNPVGRIVLLIPFLVLPADYRSNPKMWKPTVPLAVFVVIALSDMRDGIPALRLREITPRGRALDP